MCNFLQQRINLPIVYEFKLTVFISLSVISIAKLSSYILRSLLYQFSSCSCYLSIVQNCMIPWHIVHWNTLLCIQILCPICLCQQFWCTLKVPHVCVMVAFFPSMFISLHSCTIYGMCLSSSSVVHTSIIWMDGCQLHTYIGKMSQITAKCASKLMALQGPHGLQE